MSERILYTRDAKQGFEGNGGVLVGSLVQLAKAQKKGTFTYSKDNADAKEAILAYAKDAVSDLSMYSTYANDQAMMRAVFAKEEGACTRVYSVISGAVERLLVKNELQTIWKFVKVLSGAEGDTAVFPIESAMPYEVHEHAHSNANYRFEISLADESILNAVMKYAGVQFDIYQLLNDYYDVGAEINKITDGFKRDMNKVVVEALMTRVRGLTTPFQVTGYTKQDVIKTKTLLDTFNGVPCALFGSQVALSKIPVDQNALGNGIGEELVRNGFLGRVDGMNAYILDDIIDDFATFSTLLPDDQVFMLPLAQIVTLYTEGITSFKEVPNNSIEAKNVVIAQNYTAKYTSPLALGVINL